MYSVLKGVDPDTEFMTLQPSTSSSRPILVSSLCWVAFRSRLITLGASRAPMRKR